MTSKQSVRTKMSETYVEA